MQDDIDPATAHDPGDSVPEGVAVQEPAPLTEQDKAAKRHLEEMARHAKQRSQEAADPEGSGS